MLSARSFISRLCELVGLVGPLTSVQVEAFQPDTLPRFMSPSDSPVIFDVSTDGLSGFIRGRGSYAATAAASLDADGFLFYFGFARSLLD